MTSTKDITSQMSRGQTANQKPITTVTLFRLLPTAVDVQPVLVAQTPDDVCGSSNSNVRTRPFRRPLGGCSTWRPPRCAQGCLT